MRIDPLRAEQKGDDPAQHPDRIERFFRLLVGAGEARGREGGKEMVGGEGDEGEEVLRGGLEGLEQERGREEERKVGGGVEEGEVLRAKWVSTAGLGEWTRK